MNPEEQIDAIKSVMDEEVFNDDKLDRIEDILNPSTSAAELSAVHDHGYKLGVEEGRSRIFYPMIIWGAVCGIAGYVIAFAVM